MNEVKSLIQDCLQLSLDDLELITEKLSSLGVENFEDLKYIKPEEDLENFLKTVQARKLQKKIEDTFNSQGEVTFLPHLFESFSPSTSITQNKTSESLPKPTLNDDSLLDKIPFDRFPKQLMQKLERGEVPLPPERREAVRIIISGVMEHIPSPRKSHLEAVALEIVRRYPRSFKDTMGQDSIGLGHGSLLCQLISRAENCKRTSGAVKRKASSDSNTTRKKSLADSYGCVNYQPTEFPEGEDEVTQNEKKSILKSQYTKFPRHYENIRTLMSDTYTSQRIMINCKTSMRVIKSEWPFLIERLFFFNHAETLLGLTLRKTFEGFIEDKLCDLMAYVKSVDKNNEFELNSPHLHLIKILCSLFSENADLLMYIYEEDKSLTDVGDEAPLTPFIACIGNPFQLDPVCTVLVEKECLETNIPLDDAFLMWFASFYVMNLKYPKDCCATLEFIQRIIFKINPQTKGTKMEKRFGKKINFHPKVLKLINRIKNFSSSKWNI